MKATGIVRRVDNFGLINIPKSIREQFDISTGDTIEFFTDGDNIILQKISYDSNPADELRRIAKKYADEIPLGLAEQITNIAQYLEHKSAE